MKTCDKTEGICERLLDGMLTREDKKHIKSCLVCKKFVEDTAAIEETLSAEACEVPEEMS